MKTVRALSLPCFKKFVLSRHLGLGLGVALSLFVGCSSAPSVKKSQREIAQIWPDQLRVRRPQGGVVDPRAEPGGLDFQRTPLPNERWDCDSWESLLTDLDLTALQACLSQGDREELSYRLFRGAQPELRLQPARSGTGGKIQECMNRLLPRLPVPREIWFKVLEGETPQCYSARLNVEADELFGAKLPRDRWELVLEFPIAARPTNEDAVRRMLASWLLTPFFRDQASMGSSGAVVSTYVPQSVCQKCWDNQPLSVKPPRADAPLWP